MAIRYRYIKAPAPKPLILVIADKKTSILSCFLMFSGVGIISWVLWPILSFKLLVAPQFVQILEPIPKQTIISQLSSKTVQHVQAKVVEDTQVDYSKASNWFPQVVQKKTDKMGDSYKISIPKLKIEDAKVIVGGEDLSKSLIHFGGTALPGEYGNAVIFGHSTLPFFYNPKNYTTIFSTLPKLTKGDEIFVERDGVRYKFVVEDMIVVKPKDIEILQQRFDDSYITLVTCVPPGTYLERLVVRARLQKLR